MLVHELTGDRQPQAEATVSSRGRAVGLVKAVEDAGDHLGPDADTGVPYDELRVNVGPLHLDDHQTVLGSELDRVRDEVLDHLVETSRVAAHRHRTRRGPQV